MGINYQFMSFLTFFALIFLSSSGNFEPNCENNIEVVVESIIIHDHGITTRSENKIYNLVFFDYKLSRKFLKKFMNVGPFLIKGCLVNSEDFDGGIKYLINVKNIIKIKKGK